MPQLITIPYHHTYLLVVCIFGLSFFLFCKYFLPIILKLNKLILNIIFKNVKINLFNFKYFSTQTKILDIHSEKILTSYFVINLVYSQIILYMCSENIQYYQLHIYENNNIFSYICS